MIATIENFKVNLSKPIDISIPITNTDANPIACTLKPVIEPVNLANGLVKFLQECPH
jgi:hypothetical protein